MKAAAHRGIYAARARTTRAAWTALGCRTAIVSRASVILPASNWETAAPTTKLPANVSRGYISLKNVSQERLE